MEKFTADKYPLSIAALLAVLPDIIDKSACDYLHLVPYGRNLLHNLTALFLSSIAVYVFYAWQKKFERGRVLATAWAVANFGHLLGDFVFIPWFWPWVAYRWPYEPHIAKAVTQTVESLLTLFKISPAAAAIWNAPRIAYEFLFLGFTLLFLYLKSTLRIISLVSALLIWGFICQHFDWIFFTYNLKHYGLLLD